MKKLGITEEEFSLFERLFLKCRKRNCYSQRLPDGSWPIASWQWTTSLVLRHLCGETDLAIPFAYTVDLIMIDIDYKNGREWKDVELTANTVIKSLPGEPLLYQSSDSGGIRLIWFLSKTLPKRALCQWTTHKLSEAGIPVKLGICEVRLGDVPDRLPFGFHSLLLDPFLFEPRYHLSLSETIKIAARHQQYFQIEPDLSEIGRLKSESSDGRQFNWQVQELLNNGLPADITTTECLQKLAWHGRAQRALSDGKLTDFLKNWITTKHNNNSTRANSGKIQSIYSQIDRIVNSLHAKPSCYSKSSRKVGLTENEVRTLMKYPGNFKFLCAAFKILCIAKSRLSTHYDNISSYRRESGTNKWGKVFNDCEDIPNRARNFTPFITLSKNLLRKNKVPNADNSSRFVSGMERIGIMKLKRKAWPDGKKARQYWINFEFDPDSRPAFSDFDEALWQTIGRDGIRRRFTSYQANRIAKKIVRQCIIKSPKNLVSGSYPLGNSPITIGATDG